MFAQSIAQFAPLRAYVRMRSLASPAQSIRALFPKALFNETCASNESVFEIAWSFLSVPYTGRIGFKSWRHVLGEFYVVHRAGGLPALTSQNKTRWCRNGGWHRIDKDARTGLTLPAYICYYGNKAIFRWYKDDERHRVDKDARTGLTLPAVITPSRKIWYLDGKIERVDIDLRTGFSLPACVCMDGTLKWYRKGKLHRCEMDKGVLLPAVITTKEQKWMLYDTRLSRKQKW